MVERNVSHQDKLVLNCRLVVFLRKEKVPVPAPSLSLSSSVKKKRPCSARQTFANRYLGTLSNGSLYPGLKQDKCEAFSLRLIRAQRRARCSQPSQRGVPI